MAINFSASFAACLAAGLKVPRQFMYCIAQDAGAPYVVYNKDEHPANGTIPGGGGTTVGIPPGNAAAGGAPGGNANSGGGATPANTASVPNGNNGSNEWNEPFPASPPESATPMQQASPSPPYPQQHTPANSLPVSVEEDGTNGGGEQDGSTPNNTTPSHNSNNNNTQDELGPCDMGPGSTGYYPGPPRHHVLSPTTFMSYLKQPMVLTSLNSAEQVSEFHTEMFRYPGMPDLLGGNLKGAQNGQGNMQNGSINKNCSELRLFKCLTCGKDFKQKSTLLQHERIHTDSRPYACTECGKRFRQQSHLTQHLRIHANEKPFACIYCDRTFRQRAILNQHLRIHSDVSPHMLYKNGQLWPQDVPFPQQDNKETLAGLTQHQHFDGNQHDSTPPQCFPDGTINQFPAYFKDAKGIPHGVIAQGSKGMELIQSGRQAGMPLYVRCPICQKEFKQKSTLLQHGCIHIESRPYPCAECGKRFRQQSHLTQHLRIHTNEKPYGCLYCGRNFRQRTILNQHVRICVNRRLHPFQDSHWGKALQMYAMRKGLSSESDSRPTHENPPGRSTLLLPDGQLQTTLCIRARTQETRRQPHESTFKQEKDYPTYTGSSQARTLSTPMLHSSSSSSCCFPTAILNVTTPSTSTAKCRFSPVKRGGSLEPENLSRRSPA